MYTQPLNEKLRNLINFNYIFTQHLKSNKIKYAYTFIFNRIKFWNFDQFVRYCVIDLRILFNFDIRCIV